MLYIAMVARSVLPSRHCPSQTWVQFWDWSQTRAQTYFLKLQLLSYLLSACLDVSKDLLTKKRDENDVQKSLNPIFRCATPSTGQIWKEKLSLVHYLGALSWCWWLHRKWSHMLTLTTVAAAWLKLTYCNSTNFRYFRWSMVLPKLKRHLN